MVGKLMEVSMWLFSATSAIQIKHFGKAKTKGNVLQQEVYEHQPDDCMKFAMECDTN